MFNFKLSVRIFLITSISTLIIMSIITFGLYGFQKKRIARQIQKVQMGYEKLNEKNSLNLKNGKDTIVKPLVKSLESGARRNFMAVIISVLITILISAFIGFYTSHYLAGKILLLTKTAQKIREGDYSARTDIQQNDEIGILAATMDVMADSIEKRNIELERNRERLTYLINSIHAGIVIIKCDNMEIVESNTAAEKLLGVKKTEFIGKKCFLVFCAECSDGKCHVLEDGKDVDHCEKYVVNSKGEKVSVLKTVKRFEYMGEPHLLESFIDISDMRKAQEESKLLNEKLVQSQKMEAIGTLAGGIAHDFNNFLTPILGLTDLLLATEISPEEMREKVKRIRESAENASELIQQILRFSRKVDVEKYPVDVESIINETMKLIARTFPANINIVHHFDVSGIKTLANPTQLQQIFINLAINASQAIGEKDGEIAIGLKKVDFIEKEIVTAKLKPGEYVCLAVSDNGSGMEKSTQSRIFEPYFTTKDKGKGTGMGLSTVMSIVRECEGDINVYSEPGEGSAFSVYLPVFKNEKVENKNSESAENMISANGEEILIVDDDPEIINLLKDLLEYFGFEVHTFFDGRDVVNFLTEHRNIKLMISDMMMPHLRGDQLVKQVKEQFPEINTLLISGLSLPEKSEELRDKYGTYFLQKPISLKDLSDTLKNFYA